MKCYLAAVFLTLCTATANAALITYDVDRTIGDGSVTGYITTNGDTEGFLTQDEIVDWSLTLTPDVGGISTGTINPSNSNVFIYGSAITATATELSYDFTPADDTWMLFSGGIQNLFWCLETTGCNDAPDLSEHIGIGTEAIQSVDYSAYTGENSLVFATATVVPVPAAVWLFGSGLIGLAGFARRKR
jgi:hypothetical protein